MISQPSSFWESRALFTVHPTAILRSREVLGGCLTVLGDTTNTEPVPQGKPRTGAKNQGRGGMAGPAAGWQAKACPTFFHEISRAEGPSQQTANFRQTAPEIHVSPRFAAYSRLTFLKTVKHPSSAGERCTGLTD